ncbi:hypothetical protein AAFF_G00188380 [Aldrovandia affinis]|uniref:ALMS motif domain-containing protein n=1 Tax=Aldrovandia affinis TaxID=143900 RepID=A0AAD7SY59_9TELE|nr:hypothetical protein AAFF_G00188380 [Aldrovandia affinis]
MRRQREILDAFLTNAKEPQPRPSGLEVSGAERLSLMSSLLRAIEESNSDLAPCQSTDPLPQFSVSTGLNRADSLSHTSLSSDCVVQSNVVSRAVTQPHDPKPPLARLRLGILEIIEQHELSAIQEVETPIDASLATVGNESAEVSCPLTEEPEESDDFSRVERRPSGASRGSGAERSSGSGPESSSGTGRSSRLSWRERLQQESSSSPESDAARASGLPPHSSDNGLGAPMITHFKAREEGRLSLQCSEERCSLPSEQSPVDPERLSSFTISTGSFSTNEPDFSSTGINASLLSNEAAGRSGPLTLSVRHHSSGSISGHASPTSGSVLDNSSIQRIIDKYTKELNVSMAAAGNFAVVPSPAETSPAAQRVVSDPGESSSSISLPWSRALFTVDGRFLSSCTNISSVHSDQGTSTQKPCGSSTGSYLQDTHGRLGSGGFTEALEDVSKYSFEGAQDSSCHFFPLEPRLDVESSTSSSSRHSERQERIRRAEEWDSASRVTEHLSDHSSPQYQAEGRDSTLTRLIGHLSAEPTSRWLNEGLDFTMARSIGPFSDDPSPQLLGEGGLPTGELEEVSASQQTESFGGAKVPFLSSMERRVPVQMGQPPEPTALQGASPLNRGSSDPKPDAREATPLLMQVSHGSVQDVFVDFSREEQDTGNFQVISTGDTEDWEHTADGNRTLVDPTSDSFHALFAEVTQNETAEHSSTFHRSERDLRSSGGNDRILNAEVPSAGVSGERTEPLPSPELPRGQPHDPSLCSSPSPMDSLCLLGESQSTTQDSLLMESLSTKDALLTGHQRSRLAVPDIHLLALPPEGECSDSDSACHEVLTLKKMAPGNLATRPADGEGRSGATHRLPAWEKILETGSERGILEEPDLTLLNLTESTMPELSNAEEEEEEEEELREWNEPLSEEIRESVSPAEDCRSSKHESLPTHAVMLLEFQRSPGDLQRAFLQKRQDFIQRSAQRLADLTAKKEAMRNLPPHANRPKFPAQGQCSHKSHPQLLVSGGELKKVGEVKVCTPEHRKVEEAQMYQRTGRLYNQLEEVRQRKEMRLKQESYAKNREKAKAFQTKTLQKLRARQAPCLN